MRICWGINVSGDIYMDKNEQWLKWAVELQAIAQNGLFYGKDQFDRERYERIRDISAEMISSKTDISTEKVKELFCSDIGYQTPKIDTKAAIFREGKILLVQEANIETIGCDYFSLNELPKLAEEKNSKEQIEMCFQAMQSETWEALFD